ncbi:hypothetical protein JVT61DRAFT_11302 [Boletus reticuloceps]|uniref:Uncharacterized protein n=1 Tax=Boletus reticuloceps TaxID=495285 RepID=A0A8I3A4M8_9AGAM|nr:hypothetical protein JVT61DRAFT_11302 [Boletus reticuloceps]
MPIVNQDVHFLPSGNKIKPPTKLLPVGDGERATYLWYITKDEYLRLNKIFGGRDFQETGLGGTKVVGLPSPCPGCSKYTEFVDWVWTALRRGVHTREFMFNALKQGRQGAENMHDVYCSECGLLTSVRSRDNAEGGLDAPTIDQAKPIERSKYDLMPELLERKEELAAGRPVKKEVVMWDEWWLDDKGSTATYRARIAKQKAEAEAKPKAESAAKEGTVL